MLEHSNLTPTLLHLMNTAIFMCVLIFLWQYNTYPVVFWHAWVYKHFPCGFFLMEGVFLLCFFFLFYLSVYSFFHTFFMHRCICCDLHRFMKYVNSPVCGGVTSLTSSTDSICACSPVPITCAFTHLFLLPSVISPRCRGFLWGGNAGQVQLHARSGCRSQ